jgi:hypothetical protein
MVEFKVKVHPEQRLMYVPKEIYQTFGTNLKVVADFFAAVIFREDAALPDVIRSLEIILEDLRHREKASCNRKEEIR